jgi:hypothetical protein
MPDFDSVSQFPFLIASRDPTDRPVRKTHVHISPPRNANCSSLPSSLPSFMDGFGWPGSAHLGALSDVNHCLRSAECFHASCGLLPSPNCTSPIPPRGIHLQQELPRGPERCPLSKHSRSERRRAARFGAVTCGTTRRAIAAPPS